MPFFAVSIALEVAGRVQVGVVFDPNRDECFTAVRGQGAFLNGRRLRVSETPTLDESLLSTGYPYDIRKRRDKNLAEHAAFMVRCRSVREMGSAAINLALVAAGRLDAFWELVLGPWDVAAGCLMVEEAGGRVTTPAGGPVNIDKPSVLASNGRLPDEMLTTLRGGPRSGAERVAPAANRHGGGSARGAGLHVLKELPGRGATEAGLELSSIDPAIRHVARAEPQGGGIEGLAAQVAQDQGESIPFRLQAKHGERRVLDLHGHAHRPDLDEVSGGVHLEPVAQAGEDTLVRHFFVLVEPGPVAIDAKPGELPGRRVAGRCHEKAAAQ
jgi:hypothetical protein